MTASVSVIVPAYNAALTIAETLECIAAQNRRPLDVIVVDDGSKDDTASIARTFADRLSGLKVVTVENGGVSRARNIAIAAARGDIIAPVDADDLWHETYLAKLCGRLEALGPGAAFAYCHWRRTDNEGRTSEHNDVVLIEGMAFYRLLSYNFVANGSNYVFWRQAYDRAGGFDQQMPGSEDYEMQLRLAWRGEVGCVPERLVGYRDTPASLSKHWRLMAEYHLQLVHILRRKLPQADAKAMRQALADAYLHYHTIIGRHRVGTWGEAAKHFVLGTLRDPLRFVYYLGAQYKGRLYQKLGELRGDAPPRITPDYFGKHFLSISPTRTDQTILPRFTRLRIADAETFDRARAAELSLPPPPPSNLVLPGSLV